MTTTPRAVAFGTAQLFGDLSLGTSEAVLRAALGSAARVDTAPSYGEGRTERRVAEVFGRSVPMTTKVGLLAAGPAPVPVRLAKAAARRLPGRLQDRVRGQVGGLGPGRFEVPGVRASVERSLRLLGRVDRLMLHEVFPEDVTDELLSVLSGWLASGDVGRVGVATQNHLTAACLARGPGVLTVAHLSAGPLAELPELAGDVLLVGHGLLGPGGSDLRALRATLAGDAALRDRWRDATDGTAFAGPDGLVAALLGARADGRGVDGREVDEVIVATRRPELVATTLAAAAATVPVALSEALSQVLAGTGRWGAVPGGEPAGPSRSLRITQVIGTSHFAGLERYVVETSNELARRGHQLNVVGGSAEEVPPLLEAGVTWHPGASAREAMRSLATGGRRDIVHSHISKADFVALAAAPRTGGARVSTRHIADRRGYDGVARLTAPLVRHLLAKEVSVSRWLGDQVETEPDVVLVNGVRTQPDVTTPRQNVVLMAQRLAPEKDTDVGLRAFAASGLAAEGWRLLVAGRGDERETLLALAGDLELGDAVEFLGWVRDPERLFRSASTLLAPAPTEPCGLTILEAMAWGLPVVAAGSGGNLETVGQLPDARLFDPRDHVTAAALLRALAEDGAGRESYGYDLRELQRRELSITAHVDKLEQLYVDVADPRR